MIIRDLASREDFEACVELQRATWGDDFNEIVPPAILQVVQYVGGVAAGAFDEQDNLVGFVFGVSGVEQGATGVIPVHWSDMLAVRKDLRNQGIGEKLKRYQRDVLLQRGVQKVYWTFEPLDAKNAYVNFVRLGVIAYEYRENMYGGSNSPLHAGIGTDRLIAVWPIASERVARRLDGVRQPPRSDRLQRVDIPLDIQELKTRQPEVARDWRERTRAALTSALAEGYMIVDFVRETTHGSYLLAPSSELAL